MNPDPEQLLRETLAESGPRLRPDLQEPSLEALRAFVCLLDACLVTLGSGAVGEQEALVRATVLQNSFPAVVWYRAGDCEAAADWVLATWRLHAGTFGLTEAGQPGPRPRTPLEPDGCGSEYLAVYNLAVGELLAAHLDEARVRLMLGRLMAYLGLSADELGRMFSVSGDAVRNWERGRVAVPDDTLAEILLADGALSQLLVRIRPDRLARAIRRRADLFEGEPALEWILHGRIVDVAGRYDVALSYQA